MKSAEKIIEFPKRETPRQREELAFLPAALEIVKTPPSPIGRLGGWVIAAMATLTIAWACIGSVDIVASATGKIVPRGRTKVLQPLETGVVLSIRVQDGQAVKAGDVLIELDPTINYADRTHVQNDLTAAQLDIARLRAAISSDDITPEKFDPPDGATRNQIGMHGRFLREQTAEHLAKLSNLDSQKQQKEAERSTVAANIEKLKATNVVVQQLVDIRKGLLDKQLGSSIFYLEALQQKVQNEREIVVQQSRLTEYDAAIAALVQTSEQTRAEFRRTLYGELDEAERKADGFRQDLAKAQQRTKLQVLTAPIDGVVQQLSVHTIGGVVTPAQNLLVIVPTGDTLEIRAMVSNQDIGFVQEGQQAEVKVDTFNFTKYGLLSGIVTSISQDAVVKDRQQDAAQPKTISSDEATSEPAGQQLLYDTHIALNATEMKIDERTVKLMPGMAVTVEIMTGKRSIISYLLSPLSRYAHDALRDR